MPRESAPTDYSGEDSRAGSRMGSPTGSRRGEAPVQSLMVPIGQRMQGGSVSSMASGYPPHPGMQVPLGNSLDLSFGFPPQQFEKINLLGSGLSEQAVSSLVLSVQNITHLDLRGNGLNSAFGWRLVKAMKKKYLQLEYCNGVHMRALRDNAVDSLNLCGFDGHCGMYGIEVVGAIFLAHFLRLNSSLTFLGFRRNDIQKDGAKALAQSLLGNPQCSLRQVLGMGPTVAPGPSRGGKSGIDFADFRSSSLTTVHLSKRLLDDDDFTFLEEWLRRYDCVTDLDVSHNLMCRDGIRKLCRHIKDTKTLQRLNCVGLPVDLEGSALIAHAVAANETLRHASMPLGPCDENPERQQMFQQLGVGIVRHPFLESFGSCMMKLPEVKENRLRELRSDRMVANWTRSEVAVYLWVVAAMKPQIEKLQFGSSGKPTREYPNCSGSHPELWPSLISIVYDVHRSLVNVSIAIPRQYGPLAMELMRALVRCQLLKSLNLLGYGSAQLAEKTLPPEWSSIGAAPRWLIEDRVRQIKPHWQALYGLLGNLPHLETFNDIPLGSGNLRDQPELTCLLLLQCLEGVAADLVRTGATGEQKLVANLTKEADVDAFCDVMRVLSRTPVLIEFKIGDKSIEVIKAQQFKLAGPLSGAPAGEHVPRFTHEVVLKNEVVSEALLERVDCHAPIREFCFERMDDELLKVLYEALCGREKSLPVERIHIESKWNKDPIIARKRWNEKQRRRLDGIQAALIQSDRFMEIMSSAKGAVSKEELATLAPQDFAELMSGITVGDIEDKDRFSPQLTWRYFKSYKQFMNPDPDPHAEPFFIPLPLDDESKGALNIQKLSFCMTGLRPRTLLLARPDEYPDPSRVLWWGRKRFVRPGDWDEFDIPPEEEPIEDQDEQDEDPEGRIPRFHWCRELRLGSRTACEMIRESTDPSEPPYADVLLHEGLRSLLTENPSLTSLDLRGNGLTRDDANLVLGLLEQHESLAYLSMIPVTVDEAQSCSQLVLDGTGVNKSARQPSDDDPYGDDDEEPEGEAYTREALESDVVRLDEGDGFIFLSLVTPHYFPGLHTVVLRRHDIPDITLPHITDALLNLPSINDLHLSELTLSNRGASLLLSAVAEMAPRLQSLNNLPLRDLVRTKESSDGNPLNLTSDIAWNDFTLGAMHRLGLWPIASFPARVEEEEGHSDEFKLEGPTLTDVGLRGLCAMLRHFASQDRAGTSSVRRCANLIMIDISANQHITDATVADLCHTLQHPSMGSGVRHSLRELNLRSCPRLKTRSALELMTLIHHIRDAAREGSYSSSNTGAALASLRVVNGIDLGTLQATSKTIATGSRSGGAPPMLLRTYVQKDGIGHQNAKVKLPIMSECDSHFFASILHLFSQIPYCHVHVIVPQSVSDPADDNPETGVGWGREGVSEGVAGDEFPVSNDSPFPPPRSTGWATAAVQAHLDAADKLFNACPISTQLRISMAPCVPSCQDLLAEGDNIVLAAPPLAGERSNNTAVSTFGRVQQRLHEKAAKKRKKEQRDAGAQPRRPLYVNNINSQRLHDCFRTLYGQDDVDIQHSDILPEDPSSVACLPPEVDLSRAFGIATSVDLQHLEIGPSNISNLRKVTEMPVLTHVNLNRNSLGDAGVEILFTALAVAGCSIVHVALCANGICDLGMMSIAANLPSLPRLTSLELCDNCIQEMGNVVLAEAIGGAPTPDDSGVEEQVSVGPLPLLSIDLRGNKARETGAMRWAEVVADHPTLQFLCLASNDLGRLKPDSFLGLVYGAVRSPELSVLDLRENFPQGPNMPCIGAPPVDMIEDLQAELPPGEFDASEVRQGVFIRRHRGGSSGGAGASVKKGRQPQQGHPNSGSGQRHGSSDRQGQREPTTP